MSTDFMQAGLVTVGEIALLAGVKPSAVSNWRRRHPNFPLPRESTPAGDLFDRIAVIDWLHAEGRKVVNARQEMERALWLATDIFRASASIEDVTLLMLQLLYARQSMQRMPGSTARKLWSDGAATGSITAEAFFNAAARALPNQTDESHRALEPSTGIRHVDISDMLRIIDQLVDQGIDWGATASDFLRRFHSMLGARGQGATPESLTELMTALLQPIDGVVYDPACGNAMFLAEAWRAARGQQVRLFGQEISEYSWKLGWLHLALIGADFEIAGGDTLRDDRFRDRRADRIALDPPMSARSETDLFSDDRWKFGSTRGPAEWMWVQHVLYHLSDSGIAVVLVPLGALFRGGHEGRIRMDVARTGSLDVVIELAPGLLHNSSIPIALLLFEKGRDNRSDKVLFIDAKQLGQSRRGRVSELDSSGIKKIVDAVASWRKGTFESQPQFAASTLIDDVITVGDLSPRRFIEYSSHLLEIDGEPIAHRFTRQRAAILHAMQRVALTGAEVERGLATFGPEAREWPSYRLEELLVSPPRTGVRQEAEGKSQPLPFIATGDVSGGAFRLNQVPTARTCANVRDRTVTRGDLLLVSRGITAESRIGCCTIEFADVAAYAESLMRIQVDRQRLLPDYLRLFFTSRQGRSALAAVTTGSVIGNLRSDAVAAIELRVPDLQTQQDIVAATTVLEGGITALSAVWKAVDEAYDTGREGIAAGILTASPISDTRIQTSKTVKRQIRFDDE